MCLIPELTCVLVSGASAYEIPLIPEMNLVFGL